MWWHLGILLAGALAALAWRHAQARPRHRPIALLISAGIFADLTRRALALIILGPARQLLGGAPYGGGARVAFHVDQALLLLYPAALAAVALIVFARRGWLPVACLYVGSAGTASPARRCCCIMNGGAM